MNELPLNIKQKIGKYEPIEIEGLVLYPIRVSEYYEFLAARPAIEFMQQRLPVALISEPLLNAYFKIDSGQVDFEKANGMFSSALLALALALRLKSGQSIEERVKSFQIVLDQNDTTRLKYLYFVKDGEEITVITPITFQTLRQIIAEQNGIELHSDLDNPELVDAENDLASKTFSLDMKIENFITSAALIANVDETEVYEWPILKMHNKLDAARRVLDYIICGIGEAQGTTWKGGNPKPHPWFDRMKESNKGLMPIESFAGGQGLQAVKEAIDKQQTHD